MTSAPEIPAAVRALLAERRLRTLGRTRFEESTRRAAWNLIRTARKAGQ